MPSFTFEAVEPSGRRVRGELVAESEAAATRAIRDAGRTALRIVPAVARGNAGFARSLGRPAAVLELTRALSALLEAGVPLGRGLAIAANVIPPSLHDTLGALRRRVEHGDSLAAALTEHPGAFAPVYVGLVRAGERSGRLSEAFARLVEHLERAEQLRSRLLSAAIYPALLATVGGAAVLVLVLFVLPRFAELLDGTGTSLPGSTSFLLATSRFGRDNWPFVLALPTLAIAALVGARATAPGRRSLATALLAIPVLGSLRRSLLAAQTGRILGTLLAGGAALLAALDDTGRSLGDPHAKEEVERLRVRVREGVPLHRAIGEGNLYPPLFAQLVAVGEESGRLADFLLKSASLFEARAERTIQRLVALAEPAMIVTFGGLIAFVALSLFQAIYGINAGAIR